MKKMVLVVALALLPMVGFTAMYQPKKITTIEQAKAEVLERIKSYWETPEESCHSSGQYRFKDATVDYPIEECLKDAENFFIQIKNEKEASDQAKINKDEEEKQKKESELALKQIDQQTLEADLKSGKKNPETLNDALIVFDAARGDSLASAPKIKPDGQFYGMAGKIAISSDDDSFVGEWVSDNAQQAALSMLGLGDRYAPSPKYYQIKIPQELKEYYYQNAKISGIFVFVGKYTANSQYTMTDGGTGSMPVFEASFFKVIY